MLTCPRNKFDITILFQDKSHRFALETVLDVIIKITGS